MIVKDGLDILIELNNLYDNFSSFTEEHKTCDFAPMLYDICYMLSDYQYFLRKSIESTEINFKFNGI